MWRHVFLWVYPVYIFSFFFPLDLCVLSDLGLCQPLIFQVFFFSPSLFLVSTWDFSGTYDWSFVIAPYIPDVPYFIFLINFSLCSDWIFSVDLSLYLLISPLLLSPCCYWAYPGSWSILVTVILILEVLFDSFLYLLFLCWDFHFFFFHVFQERS